MTPGQIAYIAFWADDLPDFQGADWATMHPRSQARWEAAAQAVLAETMAHWRAWEEAVLAQVPVVPVPRWLFPIGHKVYWQEAPGAVWRIVARQRYEDRTGWWHTYALIPFAEPEQTDFRALTAYESELATAEDDDA